MQEQNQTTQHNTSTTQQTTQVRTTTVGRKPIPEELLEKRREFAVNLKLIGMSMNTILKMVNSKAITEGWGEVTMQTITRDIASYYAKNRSISIMDHHMIENMRYAHLDQMESTIEQLSLFLRDKNKKWKPFEYISALTELHKMQMNYAELQNWNLGRKNIDVIPPESNINSLIDEATTILIRTPSSTVHKLRSFLGTVIEQAPEDPDLKLKDNINDV